MCLLFFSINESCNDGELRLVLANNRDEFWERPTKQAEFWTTNQSCISGVDQEPGREGGTWLGASQNGRIACLVNISQRQDAMKRGRGFLVNDFLTTTESTMESYAEQIASQRDDYNGFVLTLIELGPADSKVARVTNDTLTDTPTLFTSPSPQPSYFSVGNSHVNFQWRKVDEGEERFREIVKTYGSVSTKEKLTEELFELMGDRTRYLPDPHLQKSGEDCDWSQEATDSKAALFVWDPQRQYSTRMTTVLTVDREGNCDYTEKTLQLPVSDDAPHWSTVRHHFTLQPVSSHL
ncbi:transport and Golgi organization protein 2 homolog [Babylonia areolata]|uniref:transport and Golgi organization protein 2 homolog n=1 Tax=Babylonia areolata TaxID=304850 RepID=UPI003FD5AA52